MRPATTGHKQRNRTTPTKAEARLARRRKDFDAQTPPLPGTKRPGSLNRSKT